MRYAYADPPYLGRGHYYGHPEWNDLARHEELIEQLVAEFPDGWAMSLTSNSLRQILPLCPADCRVASWCRPRAEPIPNIRPIYAWEPVIYRGGAAQGAVRDFLVCSVERHGLLVGAKPPAFCRWVADLLGHRNGMDDLEDLFPGSGSMALALQQVPLWA